MKAKKSKSIATFRLGYNCAQAVLSTFTEDLEVDTNLALSLSSGFGAGMGQLQGTCGAVTGSFMVLSLYNSQKHSNTDKGKVNTNNMIQCFNKKFTAIHGATDCKSLLNCDLKTVSGQEYFDDNKLIEKVCEKCVQNAVGILEKLLKTDETKTNI